MGGIQWEQYLALIFLLKNLRCYMYFLASYSRDVAVKLLCLYVKRPSYVNGFN